MNHTCKLSDTLTVSRIMGGLWQVADMERDGKTLNLSQAAQAMDQYVEKGITTFDMADHYGSAELIVGHYNKANPASSNVQWLTKWVPPAGKTTKSMVRAAVALALQRMHVESLDLLQFHAWNYYDPNWLDSLLWLQELKDEGLIKNLGVTNFDTIRLRIALTSGIPIVSNQICYSLLDQRAAIDMTALCSEFNVELLAFGTLAGGFLSEKWLGQPAPSDPQSWSQMKYLRFIEAAGGWNKFQHLLDTLHQIAHSRQCSIANIAGAYILQAPAVAAVIIGARLGEKDHIKDNLNLFNLEFSPEETSKIAEALSDLRAIPGDCGDEYRKPPFLTASGDLSHHVSEIPPPYPIVEDNHKQKVLSGTVWEDLAGFSRAVMKGNRILVSGTTATHGTKAIGGADPVAQTHFIIDKIAGALQSFGSSLEQVVKTRVYIQNMEHWEAIARAHGARFAAIQPANTMIKVDLIGEEYLVEIEAEAELD